MSEVISRPRLVQVRRQARRTVTEALAYTRRRRVLTICLAAGFPVALLAVWEVASTQSWIDGTSFPAPSVVAAAAVELIQKGELQMHALTSLNRILSGWVIGVVAGTVVGALMAASQLVRATLEPTLSALYVVPKLALLPVFFTLFGFGDGSKIVLVAVTGFFYLWLQTMESVSLVPAGYREAAQSLGVSRWQMAVHVLFPSALPQIFVAMRMSMASAVLVTVAAEFISGNSGLGYLIFNSRALFLLERTYVGIVAVALLGFALTATVAFVGTRLTPWAERAGRTPS